MDIFAFSRGMFLAIVSLVATAQGAPLTLTEDGRPRAVLVVAGEEASAQQAAAEIQKYIAKMSGATLPMIVEGQGQPPASAPASVYVGHTAAARAAGVQIPAGFDPSVRPDAFEEEGFVLKTMDNRLFVGGNADGPYLGNLYAAYALLNELGCRWYFPGEWGEIVPQRKTVVLPELDVSSRPDFAVRTIAILGQVPISKEERAIYDEWCVKVGLSNRETYPMAGDGFLGLLLPAREYAEAHPEYYAMRPDGTRRLYKHPTTGAYNDRVNMLCLSNPAVFEESVKNLTAAFAGEKKLRNVTDNGFGISPPDGAPFCFCDACQASSQNFNYPAYVHEKMQSEEYFGFADRLARVFPDKFVGTMAYSNREVPPQGVKLAPNVAVKHATISACVLHPNDDPGCWRRHEAMSMLRQWRRQTPHVFVRDYSPGFLSWLFIPERDMANLAINVPTYRQADVKGVVREGRKAFMQTWLGYYLTGKLLWDAEADVEALKQDFYITFFGPDAAPHVRAWWDASEEALRQTTLHAHEDWLVNHVYTAEFTRGIHRHVEAARAANLSDEQRQRVEAFALIADHLEAYAEMEQADEEMDYARAARAAQRMTDGQVKLNAIYSFFIDQKPRETPSIKTAPGRKRKYEELAALTDGTRGELVAPLPMEMRFTRDLYNEGVIGEWYAPAFDDAAWKTRNTFFLWDAQEPPLDAAGHDYDGYGWYRGTIQVPERFAGKTVRFWSGGAINEAWVWINGEYAGHKEPKVWWMFPHEFDLDVSELVKPGQENTVTIRVLNTAEFGGLFRRGFFYMPKEPVDTPAGAGKVNE